MVYVPWKKEDWRLRELLRSAGSIEDLFRVYMEHLKYITENRPELQKFALKVFWSKFYTGFGSLTRAKDALWGLPEGNPVWSQIKNAFLDQIKINY